MARIANMLTFENSIQLSSTPGTASSPFEADDGTGEVGDNSFATPIRASIGWRLPQRLSNLGISGRQGIPQGAQGVMLRRSLRKQAHGIPSHIYDVSFNPSQWLKHVYSLLASRYVFKRTKGSKKHEHQNPTYMHAVQKRCSVAATSPRIRPDEAKQAALLKFSRDLHG